MRIFFFKIVLIYSIILTSCYVPPVNMQVKSWNRNDSKLNKPSFQSNSSIDFYDFLSGVTDIKIISNKEMQKIIDEGKLTQWNVNFFTGLRQYLFDLGFDNVFIKSEEAINNPNKYICSEAALFYSWEYSGNNIKNVKIRFADCSGNYWDFNMPGMIYNNSSSNVAIINKMKKLFYYNVARDDSFTIKLKKEMTEWKEKSIKGYFDKNGFSGLEGVYERFKLGNETSASAAKYKIGLIKINNGYDVIYIGGANSLDWTEGERKAKIMNTASPNFYKVEWFMASKIKNEDVYAFINEKNGLLTFEFSGEGIEKFNEYLKLYPSVNAPKHSSSGNLDSDNFKGSGSGFAVSKDGLIVTNHHVIDGAKTVKVQITQVGKNKIYSTDIILSDPKNDLAILKINDDLFNGFDDIPYTIKKQVSNMGTTVYALGYPLIDTMGESIKLTNGIISSKMGYQGDITQYQLSVPVQPGNSGGPLFDKDGYLVGVINAKHRNAENATYAIKSNVLSNLLELVPGIPDLNKKNNLANLSLTKQVEIIENYVLLIKVK
jgi:S1-C subfamily serine protease